MFPFRISVALHYFFQDKRSLSYILIDERFSTIKDLQNHIKEIFSIQKNIYLTCNNHLLPVSEGVEILKRDETVIVVQDDSDRPVNQNVNKITNRSEQKKRKHILLESADCLANIQINNKSKNIDNITSIANNIPNRKSEINSNKESSDTNSLLNFVMLDNANIDTKFSPIECNNVYLENNICDGKQSSSKPSVFDESIDCTTKKIKQDDSAINSVNVKIIENKIISEQQTIAVQNLEPNTEKLFLENKHNEIDWKKCFNPMNKNHVLYNSKTLSKDENLEDNEVSNKIDSLANVTKNKLIDMNLSDDSIYKVSSSDMNTVNQKYKFSCDDIAQKVPNNSLLAIKNCKSDKTNIPTDSNTSEDSKSLPGPIISENCTQMHDENSDHKTEFAFNKAQLTEKINDDLMVLKKTRKRKRKRNMLKRNDFTIEHVLESPWVKTFNKMNCSDSSKQRIHIRFSDNEISDSELSNCDQSKLITENCQKSDGCDTKKSNILLDESSSLESIIKKIDLKTKELDASLFKLIHKETLPAINDIIAFKIFQLNEVYEPYVTDWIIGTVKDLKSSVIDIQILAGKMKTSEPKGKFYMETEDEKPRINEFEMQLNWSVMINPHVLLN